jgi:hypothetical protein
MTLIGTDVQTWHVMSQDVKLAMRSQHTVFTLFNCEPLLWALPHNVLYIFQRRVKLSHALPLQQVTQLHKPILSHRHASLRSAMPQEKAHGLRDASLPLPIHLFT